MNPGDTPTINDLQMDWNKEFENPIIDLEENQEKTENELQSKESIERQFKKGNKHREDYVFFDFEKDNGYVEMRSNNK